jgi:hypothetical protein
VTAAWHVFRKAAGDDITGWDTAVATAEIRSLTALAHQAVASSAQSVDARRPHGGAWRPGGATGRVDENVTASDRGPDQSRGQDMGELAALPGLETVHAQLTGWIAVIRAELARREAGIAVGRPAWKNLLFTGGPGTGKSRAARTVARIYQALGVLVGGHVAEIAAAELTGTKLRETGMLTREAFNRAGGGILMINGAHAWSALPDGGQHVLRCLYQELTSSRDDGRDALAVILTGQADPLHGLLRVNPALAARFPAVINFPSYTAGQLAGIFATLAREAGFTLAPAAAAKAATVLAQTDGGHGSGNARLAVRLLDQATARQARRIMTAASQTRDLAGLSAIQAEDIPAHICLHDRSADDERPGQYL